MLRVDSNGNFYDDETSDKMLGVNSNGEFELIAPVNKKKKKKDGFFENLVQPGAFEDGYQFGDLTKTLVGTGADIYQDVTKGALSNLEGYADFFTNYGSIGLELIGQKDAAQKFRDFAQKDLLEESGLIDRLSTYNTLGATNTILNGNASALNPFDRESQKENRKIIEEKSVSGESLDNISQGVGQLGGQVALNSIGIPWQLTAFVNGASGEMNNAFKNGADYKQALISGLISGGGEVATEYIGGGANKLLGMTSIGSKSIEKLGSKITNKVLSRLTKLGFDMAGEGAEEVASGYITALGQQLTYMTDKEINELYSNEDALNDFISGALVSGVANIPGNVRSIAKGQNAWTGYTQNEQKVYDTLLQERINEEQSESEKPLTKKQINAIEEEFKQDFENGNISTKKIEEVLGYEDIYNNLKDRTENALAKTLTAQDEAGIREEAKQEYAKRIKDDEFIKKNYYEDTQRTKAYNVDVNQYDEKYRGTIQKAIDSGILNNSTKTHQFVDFISKLAADKGVTFDFTNNEALKNSSLGIDGATVNGYVNANGDITLNINSAKSLNSVVGHEITHILEGSELYQALSDSLKEYAETKGEYAKRYNELQKLYKNVEGADITKELNADLVGDYLFTNQEFINHLTQNRNLFQRIYDEIKYLVKQATAGSKEQKQLLKAQKMFEQAYKDNSVKLAEQEANTNDIQYSLTSSLQDDNINTTTDINNDFFKEHESDFDKNNGKSHILYDNYGNKIEQTTNVYKLEKGNNLAKLSTTLEQNVDDNYGKLYIDELYVKNKGEGLGTDIINSLKQYAKENNLDLYTMKELGNPKTQKFWNSVTEQDFGLDRTSRQLYSPYQPGYNISKTDNNGNKLSYQQRQYFKDSKVVDENRDLQVVYHQTNNEFTEFKNGYSMRGFKNANFFTNQEPKQVLKHMMKGYVNITNPLYLENTSIQQNIVDDAIANGYDGIINQNVQGIEGKNEIVTFNSNQFKNIDNTNPTNSPDIRYSLSEDAETFKTPYGVEVVKNPSTDDYIQMRKDILEEYPWLRGEKILRQTYDEEGNVYYWSAYDAQHADVEPYINSKYNTRTFQNDGWWKNPIYKDSPKDYSYIDTSNFKYSLSDNQDERISKLEKEYNDLDFTREVTFEERDALRNDLNKLIRSDEYKNAETKFKEMIREDSMTPDEISQTPEYTLMEQEQNIRNKLREYDEDIKVMTEDMTRISEMIENEQKEHRTPQDSIKQAKETMGTTNDYREAGYLLQDGDMLDFSGRYEGSNTYGRRAKDHREINEFGYDMNEFIRLGNIRMKPEGNGFEMAIEPTKEQYSKLYDYIDYLKEQEGMYPAENSYIDVDIERPDSSQYDTIEYKMKTPTSKIINDIKEYWRTGEFPKQSEFSQFYSLSKNNEIAPTRKSGLTYGKDIELQQTAPIIQDLVDLQNDIAAIKEDYRKQSEDIKKELQALREERKELDRGVNEVAPIDEYTPVESDIAPYESETAYPNTNVVPLDDKLLNKYKKYFKENFYFKGKQLDNAMEGIKELSANPELTQEDVYKYFKKNFGKYETQQMNYSINEAKSDLRHMEIGVSDEVKKDIAHRYESYNDFRKKNFGKLILVEYNGQNGVDTRFEELSKQYPDLFDANETINPADQLVALSEIANNKGYDTYFAELDDNEVRAYANEMYSMIKDFRNETNQRLAEEQIPLSYLEEIAPTQEEETIDDYYNNLNERITNLETELENIPKREYYDIQSREMDERLSERIEPEKRDILDLINLENAKKSGKKVELVKPVVAKEKGVFRSGIDTLKTMFTNSNAEIDNLSKESGNKMIKIAGDMLNNYSAEASYDITNAQTDNNGNEIKDANGKASKGVQQLFAPAKEKGLEAPFNDYLINYSNIDRHKAGKGSKTPLSDSERVVKYYEEKYPVFKIWAADIWNYSKNVRDNMLESGLINQSTYDMLSKMYPHYVPYISDGNNFDASIDKINELKARPIKRAVGGSTELYPVEEALTRYTFSQKKALRTNNLYKELVNEFLKVKNESPIGADMRTDYTNLSENLYRDDNGNYLTAYIDGERKSVKISDDLFKALRNDMDTQVKDLEKRLSLITKPLQAFSDVRRKMLTSWRPSFALRNPIKDIQDAFFNSKHTTQMAKNYIPGIVELVKNSTPEAKQFKALYGEGNLMGTFENESGLYETKKGLKNNKFLKGLSSVNEIMELAPRYAEFKASLQAGESVEEAMYNAREVTTNFSRGGVITKALNRNGFTFLNASVQGFDKFIRNFSGENGAKGIANSLLKAVALGVTPAIFNELAFGIGDDKDEEYEALPDYVKDNYYIIKLGDGNFLRIPKGRILSVFGSAARRTIEMAEGEEDAFKGYLSNANSQIGINNPEENNIFAPFMQTFGSKNGKAWYGGDIVPSRLQNKPVEEQYDASTDKMSIWLGEHLGVSPYKINYLIDQYSGGIGDLLLPYITDEAKNKGGFIAPIVSEFTTDSTTNNKYVSDFYTKNDELKVKANSSKATDSDLVKNQYMYSVSKQMSELYAERRKVQENNSLTKEQKYEKAQAIKKEINKLAKQGLDTYESGTITGNYAAVGNQEFYKNAKGKWTDVSETDKENINSLGLNNRERDSYFKTSNELYNIDQRYKNLTEGATDEEKTKYNAQRKVDVINAVKSANLPDEGKAALYDKKYADTDTLNAVLDCNIDFDSYLDLQAQNFTADKDKDGKSISGSKKAKVYGYINSMDMPYEQKIMLAKLEYKSDDTYNREIISYLNNDDSISYQDMTEILKAMGFKVDEYGNITWE